MLLILVTIVVSVLNWISDHGTLLGIIFLACIAYRELEQIKAKLNAIEYLLKQR
jgi:hypothetical protein